MSRGEITLVAIGAFLTVILWTGVLIYVGGLYLGCIPDDPEYVCPAANERVLRCAGTAAGAFVLTVVFWGGLRRAGKIRRDN